MFLDSAGNGPNCTMVIQEKTLKEYYMSENPELRGFLSIHATTSIKTGDELFLDYGNVLACVILHCLSDYIDFASLYILGGSKDIGQAG
jgi:hypothetical protein